MRSVWAVVRGERARLRREVPISILVVSCYRISPDPAGLRYQQEVSESLLELVKCLPKRLREVITAYYGLSGEDRQTLQAIGKQYGVSRARVGQLKEEALVWLRQPAHSQALRSLMARHNQRQYELADHQSQVWLKRRGGRNGRHE